MPPFSFRDQLPEAATMLAALPLLLCSSFPPPSSASSPFLSSYPFPSTSFLASLPPAGAQLWEPHGGAMLYGELPEPGPEWYNNNSASHNTVGDQSGSGPSPAPPSHFYARRP
eukprot:768450-Hanusia_phi.AAC.3